MDHSTRSLVQLRQERGGTRSKVPRVPHLPLTTSMAGSRMMAGSLRMNEDAEPAAAPAPAQEDEGNHASKIINTINMHTFLHIRIDIQ